MKFLVSFALHEGKLHDTLKTFAAMSTEEEQALMGDKLKLVGRWHDLASGSGVGIYETEDASALMKYALAWNETMDIEITPVVDDDEAKALGQ